jgi:hypothetical protein
LTTDIPIGVLHALTLGPVKYAVSLTKKELEASKLLEELQTFMEAAPTAAIVDAKTLNASYMIKHAGSLVGKELRIWAQTASGFLAPLVASGKVSRELWRLWYWLGHLTRLLLIESVPEASRDVYLVRSCGLRCC